MVMKVEGQFPAGTSPVQRTGRPREFGKKQQNPVRRFGGIAAVLLLHIVLIYALLNGLATKVVQVIQHPIETKIIEPVKPPPPPPLPTVQLPPPKFAPPPPPFVPPPEVQTADAAANADHYAPGRTGRGAARAAAGPARTAGAVQAGQRRGWRGVPELRSGPLIRGLSEGSSGKQRHG